MSCAQCTHKKEPDMFIKFDPALTSILCCPLCKSGLSGIDSGFVCEGCGLSFPLVPIESSTGHVEKVYDFRLSYPSYCVPQSKGLWEETQVSYEEFSDNSGTRDSLQEYLDEIDSVKEIYTEEFHISGRVLDVGGHQGRLRYFLGRDVTLYVSIDPHIAVFRGLDEHPNLLKAYPCLSESCNFLAAHAEHLPFKSRSFDWVHMRSVVDHFEDPYQAFLEAYRVTKIGGKLLVGLAILEKIKSMPEDAAQFPANESLSTVRPATRRNGFLPGRLYLKWKSGGWQALSQAVMSKVSTLASRLGLPIKKAEKHDDHMYRFGHAQLIDLMERTGWQVVKQHWQKPPYYYCIYAMGEAQAPRKPG